MIEESEDEMTGWTSAIVESPEWVEVSAERACPSCGATDGCSVMEDGIVRFVRCVVRISDLPVVTGGWLHRITIGPMASTPLATPEGELVRR